MKNDENGQLSCGIYSSPAAARSPLQGWVGDRSIRYQYYVGTESQQLAPEEDNNVLALTLGPEKNQIL